MNRLVLQARIVERSALRYTPAGIPAINFALKCEGPVIEDGKPRRAALEIKAKAVGASISSKVVNLSGDAEAVFGGFVASSANGRGAVFHVTSVERVDAAA